jgi:TatD DNase family protein
LGYGIIDSHCHLDGTPAEADAELVRARAAGVVGLVAIGSGSDLGFARRAVALAERHDDVWATIGIHPHDVKSMAADDFGALEQLATHPRVVGIGETGLDYHYDHSPRETQREAFSRFLALARARALPVVIHVRDAHADCVALCRAADYGRGVIHCFTGTPDDARAYLELGFHISLSGIVTFKSAGPIREAAALVPPERLLVETDAPYLAPVPMRGQRNQPAYIVHTVEFVALLRGTPAAELAAQTARNARDLFRLDSPQQKG